MSRIAQHLGRVPVLAVVYASFMVIAGAAGVIAANPQIPPPVRLIVQPESLDLSGFQARHGLLVTSVAADGSLWDVTSRATFASANPDLVTVSAVGECVGKQTGAALVNVSYAGQSASVSVTVRDSQNRVPPSFLHDVLPLLTRTGCNQGACHGKNAGQGGFRLSLRGYAPEWDHDWITREFLSRRISRVVPEDSLILRKPAGQVPHAGGKLFKPASREYQLLLDWVSAGAPGPAPANAKPENADAKLEKIAILPGSRVLSPGQEQQLLVRATFSDGRVRDVTWLSKFNANDASVVEVSPAGKARVLRQGETAVRVTFEGLVEIVIFTIPYSQTVDAGLLAERRNLIDEHLFNKLAALRIPPSAASTDEEFLRRASLDTIGTLPTPEEVRALIADARPDKRARAIDQLLERSEFVDYWAMELGDIFQNRRERDHDVRGTKGVRAFHAWLRQQLAVNRPWDELARDVLTASGSSTASPAVGYFVVTVGEKQRAQESEVVASVAQAFLGTRIGCAQCHNHPLEKYTQDDYYHFAGFFARIKLDRKNPALAATTLAVSDSDPNQNKNPIGVVQPRTGQFLKPQPLDRSVLEINPGDDPRVKLAEWMTHPKNEYFSGSIINRVWRHFYGVGLVEPVDDLRPSNPPTNPELWRALNQEFVSRKFDLKHLLRLILNSRAYQLSSTTLAGNRLDTRYYSHYYVRRLPAEVLLDAVCQSTGVPEQFPGYPLGARAIQLPDPGLKSYFLSLFGRSERVTACACERNGEVTMPQLLHLQNGEGLLQNIRSADARLAALVKAGLSDPKVIEELFLATLSRAPSAAELSAVQEQLAAGDSRDEVFRDLFWALLNSKEFAFNH